jgi:hypothetical protein
MGQAHVAGARSRAAALAHHTLGEGAGSGRSRDCACRRSPRSDPPHLPLRSLRVRAQDWAELPAGILGDSLGGDAALVAAAIDDTLEVVIALRASPNWLRPGSVGNRFGEDADGDELYHSYCPFANAGSYEHQPAICFVVGERCAPVASRARRVGTGCAGFRAHFALLAWTGGRESCPRAPPGNVRAPSSLPAAAQQRECVTLRKYKPAHHTPSRDPPLALPRFSALLATVATGTSPRRRRSSLSTASKSRRTASAPSGSP